MLTLLMWREVQPMGFVSSCLVVWIPLFLDPSDGVFGRFDLAALCGCRTLNFCLFVYQLLLAPGLTSPPCFLK